jgi:O-Antigen ligase
MVLSLNWSPSAERTMAEVALLLTYGGLVVLALCSLNRFTFRSAAGGLSFGAIGVVCIAVGSRLFPSVWPDTLTVGRAFHTDRLSFPLDYWNAVGALGATTAAIGLAWSAHARMPLTRASALAVVPVCSLAVYLSYSRGGVIGTAVAVVAVLGLSRNRWTTVAHTLAAAAGSAIAIVVVRGQPHIAHATGGSGAGALVFALGLAAAICVGCVVLSDTIDLERARLPRQTSRWAAPASVAAVLLVGIVIGHGAISRAWHQFTTQDRPTTGADPAARLTSAGGNRDKLWDAALDAFSAHPFNGIGPGTYEYYWQRHGNTLEYVRNAHSLYLEQLAELGVPGLALLLGLLGSLIPHLTDPGDIGANVAFTAAGGEFRRGRHLAPHSPLYSFGTTLGLRLASPGAP